MSDRNYLSAREKNLNKLIDCLPNINQQQYNYRSSVQLSACINRNLNYSYDFKSYDHNVGHRVSTPLSDFFSESETGTPDIRSDESDSSAGSALCRNTAEATRILAAEWECIERTIYDEDGEKVKRPHLLEECKQWQQLHPQLRVVGRAIQLPEKRLCYGPVQHEEIIAVHYSDYEQFSESEDRLSQSSTDITPHNSPIPSVCGDHESKTSKEHKNLYKQEDNLIEEFGSLLQITPLQLRSPFRKRHNTLIKSEIASSKWMRNSRVESPVHSDRNSAKSFISLDMRSNHMSANEHKMFNRVYTARHHVSKLEPLCSPEKHDLRGSNGVSSFSVIKKVSLPPLQRDDRNKVGSAKKQNFLKLRRANCKSYLLDRV